MRHGAAADDRVNRGAENLLVMLQPPAAEFANGDGVETQQRHVPGFQLSVDLRRQAPRCIKAWSDAGPTALAIVVILQIPDAAADVGFDPSDAECITKFEHGLLRESSRHKTPQKRHKRVNLREPQKCNCPWIVQLRSTGRLESGEGGIRTPETV